MVAEVSMVILIATMIIVIIMMGIIVGMFQLSLEDYTDREDWDEIIFYALVAVVALVVLSFINVGIVEEPIPISLNMTGIMVPIAVVLYLLIRGRVMIIGTVITIGLVAVVAFPLTMVVNGGSYIQFPYWLVPAGVAAGADLVINRMSGEKTGIGVGGIAFAGGSIGMLIGGDLLRFPELMGAGGNQVILGAGGILDFVFLTGVVALSMVWTFQGGIPLARRFLKSATDAENAS
jgi:uncharacterized membrane protein